MQTNDIENTALKCQCCKQERLLIYLRHIIHDFSDLFNLDGGTVSVNCRYCVDMPMCKEKALSREWVIKNLLGK